ncbi:asparagine synthase-related protein [Nonomuraea sp. NPDC001684]
MSGVGPPENAGYFRFGGQEVARHVKVVQSGQGADEVFAGYSWFPPLAGVPRERAAEVYCREFADRPHEELSGVLAPGYLLDRDVSGDFVREHVARPGADTALDAVLRLETTAMLIDDPVKRVDNMTMAHGLEARTPFLDHDLVELAAACPDGLKLAHGGKGVLKDAARRLLPARIVDRPKGYFPVPAVRHVEGALLDLVRDALTSGAARARGLFRPEFVRRLLADPESDRATTGVNTLWQIGLLELWLQAHQM